MWDTTSMYLKACAPLAAPGLGLHAAALRRAARPTAARAARLTTAPASAPGALQVVDKFNDLLVSCYNTAGHTRLLLLHDSRATEEGIRAFFQDVHELYLKARPRQVARLRARAPRTRRARPR